MSTPEYILKKIRQRYDIDESDTSGDADIENMTPLDRFKEVCAWELGDRDWANQVLSWAKDCGIDSITN